MTIINTELEFKKNKLAELERKLNEMKPRLLIMLPFRGFITYFHVSDDSMEKNLIEMRQIINRYKTVYGKNKFSFLNEYKNDCNYHNRYKSELEYLVFKSDDAEREISALDKHLLTNRLLGFFCSLPESFDQYTWSQFKDYIESEQKLEQELKAEILSYSEDIKNLELELKPLEQRPHEELRSNRATTNVSSQIVWKKTRLKFDV